MTTLPIFRPVPRFLITDPEANWLSPEEQVTNGPFIISPLDAEEDVTTLQRNPSWPLPFRGNVELVNVYEYDDRLEAYEVWQENLLDVTLLPFQLTGDYLNNPAIRPPVVTNGEMFYLGFNFDSPVFGIPEVRRAFSAAIDRERLLREVYGDRGAPMRHFVPPGVLHAAPLDQVGLGYSPSRALVELENGGFISCRLLGEMRYMISASDLALQHAEALIRMWVDNLGCAENQFIIEQVQFGTLLAKTRRNAGPDRPDLWDLGWASFYPDAHDWFDEVLHCENSDNRQNRPCSEVDIILENAAVTFAPEERQALYRQAENIFFDEVGSFPIAPLYVRGDYFLTQTWLSYPPSLYGGEQFDTYRINQEIKDLERSQ
jgi:oligopeptide transport system substrate-binding protein